MEPMQSKSAPIPSTSQHQTARTRVQVDVSPHVGALLEHCSTVLGVPQSQLVNQALLRWLPDLVDQATALRSKVANLPKR